MELNARKHVTVSKGGKLVTDGNATNTSVREEERVTGKNRGLYISTHEIDNTFKFTTEVRQTRTSFRFRQLLFRALEQKFLKRGW